MKRIAILTGVTSGMGKEFAFQLDYHLKTIDEFWLIGRNLEKLENIKEHMKNKCQIFVCDLNERTELKKVMRELYAGEYEIKILVNCAGYGMLGKFEEISYNDNMGMIDVNCRALTSLTYDCIPFMCKNSRIINVASAAAFVPQPEFAVYAASKSYVLSFSRALNAELKGRDIFVTAVCPGPVDTNFFNRAESYGTQLEVKKLIMAKPEKVVNKAIKDAIQKKEISVYGTVMNFYKKFARMIPNHYIIEATRLLNKLK